MVLLTERDRIRKSLAELVQRYGKNRSSLLPILQEIQRQHYHISEYAMQVVADLLDIHPVEVFAVVSFYSFLDFLVCELFTSLYRCIKSFLSELDFLVRFSIFSKFF